MRLSFLTHLFLWVRINSHSRLITRLIQNINPDHTADMNADNLVIPNLTRLWETVLICGCCLHRWDDGHQRVLWRRVWSHVLLSSQPHRRAQGESDDLSVGLIHLWNKQVGKVKSVVLTSWCVCSCYSRSGCRLRAVCFKAAWCPTSSTSTRQRGPGGCGE